MAVELDHTFETARTIDDSLSMRNGPMTFTGTLEITEQDAAAHRAVLTVKSREAGGQGHANATITFTLRDGGGTIHTNAQITGKAASMGEGVVAGVLDALVADFAGKLGKL